MIYKVCVIFRRNIFFCVNSIKKKMLSNSVEVKKKVEQCVEIVTKSPISSTLCFVIMIKKSNRTSTL